MTGIFITVEGPDGAGKTSVIAEVSKRLSEDNIDYILTREPGGIDIAEQIRSVILNPKNTAMDAKTEALLYAASRRQHLVEKVIPALKENKLVLCDRFIDSSLAYQGCGREIGIEEVYSINEFAIDGIMPDLTLYLDVDPQVGLDRINKNRKNLDRLDVEKIDFHERVYQGYEKVKELFKNRITIIDANRTLDEVVEDVYQVIVKKVRG
jgi:dTMP kinase